MTVESETSFPLAGEDRYLGEFVVLAGEARAIGNLTAEDISNISGKYGPFLKSEDITN